MAGSLLDAWKNNVVPQQQANPTGASTPTPVALTTNPQAAAPQQPQQGEQHWWDTVMQNIGKAGERVGAGIDVVEEDTTQALQRAADQHALTSAAAKIAWAPFQAVGGATQQVMNGAAASENIWSHVTSTVFQATTRDNPLYKDGVQLSDFSAMWAHADTLSPGQALVNAASGGARQVMANDNLPGKSPTKWADNSGRPGADAGTINTPGFDIYAQEQNLKANNYWNLGTGAADVGIQLATAKGIGAAGTAVRGVAGLKSVAASAQDLAAERAAMDSHYAFLNEVDGATSNAIGKSVQDAVTSTDQIALRNNPLIALSTRRDKVASLLSKTTDYNTAKEIILADQGDRQAVANLMRSAPDDVWNLMDMNTTLAKEIAEKGVVDPASRQALHQTFESAVSRDAYYTKVMNTFLSADEEGGLFTALDRGTSVAPTGLNYATGAISRRIGDSAVGRALQQGVAEAGRSRAGVRTAVETGAPIRTSFQILGTIGDAAPVRILARVVAPGWNTIPKGSPGSLSAFMAGRRAMNLVTYQGMRGGDTLDELLAYTSSKPLRGMTDITLLRPDADGIIRPTTINMGDYRRDMADKVGRTIGDPTATQAVVERVHHDMVSAIAYEHEVADPTVLNAYVQGLRQAHESTVQSIRDNGYFYDNNGHQIMVEPSFRRQLADSTMLTPLDKLDRALTSGGEGVSSTRQLLSIAGGGFQAAFDAGQAMFRTATLFRIAYTLKNSIAEPLMSAFLATGHVLAEDGVKAATTEFLRNRGRNLASLGYSTYDKVGTGVYARSVKELEDLHVQRIEQNHIYESLKASVAKAEAHGPDWNARNYLPLQEQTQKVAQSLDNINRLLDHVDPGWRVTDAQSTIPTLKGIEETQKTIEAGLSNPKHADRLRSQAAGFRTRAANAADPAAAANYERYAAAREGMAAKWDALTPEDRATLRAQKDELDANVRVLLDKLDDPARDTKVERDAIKTQLDAITSRMGMLHDAAAPGAARRDATKARVRTINRPVQVTLNGGETYMAPALADPGGYGKAIETDFSSSHTLHVTNDPTDYVGTQKQKMYRDGTATPVQPGARTYYDEYVHSVNHWLRNDPLAMQAAAGASPQDMAAWLHTPVGQQYRRDMHWTEEDVTPTLPDPASPITEHQWSKVDEAYQLVNSYLPTPELKATALTRDVTHADLAKVPFDQLPTVSGGALQVQVGKSMMGHIRAGMDRTWKFLAVDPENTIGRFPFAQRAYKTELQSRIDQAIAQGATVTTDTVNAMAYGARREALRQVERTFYNIQRMNNFVFAARYLTVYPAATANSFVRFARLGLENPGRAAALITMWDDVYSHFGVDGNGDPTGQTRPGDAQNIIINGVPEPVAKAIGSHQIQLSQNSLQLIGGNVSPGWLVTIPIEMFALSAPDRVAMVRNTIGQETFDNIFPYGLPLKEDLRVLGVPVDQMTPGVVKDVLNVVNQDSAKQNAWAISQYKYDMAMWEKAKSEGRNPGPVPTVEEARDKAYKFSVLTAVSKFVVPGSPNFKADGSAEQKMFSDQYSQILKSNGGDSDKARKEMMVKHGDWVLPYLISTNKSLFSIPSNVAGYQRIRNNEHLVSQILADNPKSPQVANVMFGDLDHGVYDPEVTAWMQNQTINGQPIVDKANPEEFAARLATEQSFMQYDKDLAARDAAYTERTGMTVAEGTQRGVHISDVLGDSWKTYYNQFLNDPANIGFKNAMESTSPGRAAAMVKTMNDLLANPQFMKDIPANNTYWLAMKQYTKDQAVAQQAYSDATGNPEYQARVGETWDAYVNTEIMPLSTQFATLYSWYLGPTTNSTVGRDLVK